MSASKRKESLFKLNIVEVDRSLTKNTTSFSQFQKYMACPLAWKLRYIDKIKDPSGSIFFAYGSAMHETIQHWLDLMYNVSSIEADNFDFAPFLKEHFIKAYTDAAAEGGHFSTPAELKEFYHDGLTILEELRDKRRQYFKLKNISLVGIEVPLQQEIANGVSIVAYLDLVFYDHDEQRFLIMDIKTSNFGWKAKEKKDIAKTSQLVVYKDLFAKQYQVNINNVDVEFFVLKRKLYENSEFPQKRFQQFVPPSGTITRSKVLTALAEFVKRVYNPDGSYNLKAKYPAIAGPKNYNCRYCPFKDNDEKCPKKLRKEINSDGIKV